MTGTGPGLNGANLTVESSRRFLGDRMVAIAFLSLFGAFGLNLAIGQFFTPLSEQFGWSLGSMSAAVAINMLVWGLLQPVMGQLVDRFGPRAVMSLSAAAMGVAYLGLAFVNQLWQFTVLFGVLTAVGFAGCSSMASSVLVSRWYTAQRARMLARSSMGINAGQLLLLPLTGLLITSVGSQGSFLALGAVMLIAVVPAIAIGTRNAPADVAQLPDDGAVAGTGRPASAAIGTALRDGQFWLTSLSFGACGYTLYMIITHLPKYAVELGGGKGTGGALMAVVAAASAASMLVSANLAGRWGKSRVLIYLHLLRAVAFTWIAMSSSVSLLFVGALLFGLSSFPVIPLTTGIIADRFGATAMGGILGSTWLIHQLMAAAGVFGGALLHDATGGYSAAFASGAALLLVGAVLIAAVREGAPLRPHGSAPLLQHS
ncbi:MAG TPA: MFS transporter [Micromonosporaceae bacterium]